MLALRSLQGQASSARSRAQCHGLRQPPAAKARKRHLPVVQSRFDVRMAQADQKDSNAEALKRMSQDIAAKFPEVKSIDVTELQELLNDNSKKVVLVDVRTAPEQDVSVIPQSLRRPDFEARKGEFTDHTVVCYCTVGFRSSMYAKELQKQDFDVANLKGFKLDTLYKDPQARAHRKFTFSASSGQWPRRTMKQWFSNGAGAPWKS